MKVIIKKEAMKVFYYLLLADGTVTEDEEQSFVEIGNELDPENFGSYKDEIIKECISVAHSIDQLDDYIDILQEATDRALAVKTNIIEDGIPPRLLLWDLMVLAYSNQEYEASENKIIRHVVRMLEIDRSIYLEMKQMAETSIVLENELKWLQQQNRPYSEIRPIVDEIEERTKVLRISAENLVADEVIVPDPEEKSNVVTKAVDSINEKVVPKLGEVKDKTGNALTTAKDTVEKGVKKGAKGFLTGITKGAKFVTRKTLHAVDAVADKARNRNQSDEGQTGESEE